MPRPTARAATPPAGRTPPRIGLALAGGGPIGAIYEIGALCALEDSIRGLDCTQLSAYVGVSAGAFIAAGLANGMTPRAMCAAFIENVGGADELIDPGLFTRPAWREYRHRLGRAPGLLRQAARHWWAGEASLAGLMADAGQLLPNGLFDNQGLEAHLQRLFSLPGRSDDFRRLQRKLVVVATDLDSGQAAPFGTPGWDDTPISRAVIASAALPGLFPPVEIGGRSYVDGALKKTVHASVLLDQGLDLLLCLNPLVPFAAGLPPQGPDIAAQAPGHIPRLAQAGLPTLLSQTFRSLIHSRLALGLKGHERSHPDCDILLFEPDPADAEMFRAGTFSYALRKQLANHAFQQTRHMLRQRQDALAATLGWHGLQLDLPRLHAPRHLIGGPTAQARTPAEALVLRTHATLDELARHLGEPPRAVQPR